MKRSITLVLMLILLLGSKPSFAAVVFYDDAEDAPNSKADWVVKDFNNSISVSSEVARAGNKSYKFVSGPWPEYESHCELVLAGRKSPLKINNFIYNQEYWMGWSVYIPADFRFPHDPNHSGLIGQWHAAPDACDNNTSNGPTGAFFFNKDTGGFRNVIQAVIEKCTGKKDDRWIAYNSPPLIKGGWNDIVVNFKFDYREENKPFFKIWLNGFQYADDAGINCWNDSRGPTFRMGIYAHPSEFLTVYYDEIRVGDEKSSFEEVAPKGKKSSAESKPSVGAPKLRLSNYK